MRPIWRDNRLHYALSRAAIGAPNLLAEPFTAGNTDAQLDQAAHGFINHPRGMRFEDGKLIASRIYLWYEADFGGSTRNVLDHLRHYVQPERSEELADAKRIDDYEFYWELNEGP